MRGSLQVYKKVSIDSQLTLASPHKVVQMLMAGSIERLIQGKTAMQQGNISVKGECLGKALDIIISLRSCLSMDDGGDVAKNLDQLYEFMITQISTANNKNTPKPIDDVIEIIREIKSAWDQIPRKYHNLTVTDIKVSS
ncbi:flagellar protein [Candidatus Photodesmus blepharus]|uniref:Flagellar secretion chaperone FliS n=1 Tax=Candidatus Photodesmus blepharonis TaxID=1179155 RepID=A0A084CP06_9GAMM|nr:flagellar export chaperone FliS [Candidatus Photodesmus blepharus]KEY91535.1 flagellar protein [Candidatus Photodesmus blepharus]